MNRQEPTASAELSNSIKDPEILVIEKNSTKTEKEYIYIPSRPAPVYHDRLSGVVYEDHRPKAVSDHPLTVRESVISEPLISSEVGIHTGVDYEISKNIGDTNLYSVDDRTHGAIRNLRHRPTTNIKSVGRDDRVDVGLLDRRLSELQRKAGEVDLYSYNEAIKKDQGKIGINKEDDSLDFSGLTLVRDGDDTELGELEPLDSESGMPNTGYGTGKGGELYAYNFPSRGVGAGIGSSAIGAGAGGGAGLSAGIGEGVLNGETVPTLGGVGTTPSSYGGSPGSGGVGGLVGGAGAGGAAGLTQGYVADKLGLGPGRAHGGYGGGGEGRGYNHDHLPKDGALHIMMHVDGSGSILNTRKQLEEMKETLLKDALLPYYKNDEELYNRRVTIISNAGERTLNFFTEAAEKDNVLAIAFQDEAQPAYHLPNFNKKPEDHYMDDLKKLKSSLNGYNGTYRGVMFQVDRGKTFAKSFKEFVGNAFKGEGYLESASLKKYYRDTNQYHIKNKDGVVFSDEYHAKDSGDPQYYLNLIFEASKKVGIDLNIYGAGDTDGNLASEVD